MKLVIAEKPSVAQSIAKVIGAYQRHDGYMEGNGYLVSWCVGHLVSLAQPEEYDESYKKWRREDLPILPETWKWEVSKGKEEQFAILKKLMEREDVKELVCATDAGREGELIFRLVYEKAGCQKPFLRLWISSMEDRAIKEGFENLRDGHEYDRLYYAALCRCEADWMVGINATRLFTTLYQKRLTVGRVQTPTLVMLTERNKRITDFKKEKYFNVHIDCGGAVFSKEKVFDEVLASEIKESCSGAEAMITAVTSSEKAVQPPKLYDLTTLQRESNRYYGYTAQKTLDYTQSLYEKKLVTYPRTDSQYLTTDMEDTARDMTEVIHRVYGFATGATEQKCISRILNNQKVSDHHAIIPTAELERQNLSELPKGERDILLLIAQRLLCATGEPQVILETQVMAECGGYEFGAKGKVIKKWGWKDYENCFKRMLDNKKKEDSAEITLPELTEGQSFQDVQASLSEHYTSPPKPYTEDTLLSAMENAGNDEFEPDTEKKGIGTPATRASMIEKLVSSDYVQRKGKQLVPTEAGINLAEVLPEDIKSPKLTAEWENTLMQIEKGYQDMGSFLSGISDLVLDLVNRYTELPPEEKSRFASDRIAREEIGKCPRCGSPVYEGQKNYYCSSKECNFCIWKESKWLEGMKKKVTTKMAKALLEKGFVRVSGLYSQRTGRNFDANLVLEDTGKYVNFKLDFTQKKKG